MREAYQRAIDRISTRWKRTAFALAAWTRSQSPLAIATAAISGALLVGFLDYLTGYEVALSGVYILPIALAAWFVGRRFSYALSVGSVVLWITSDLASGAKYSAWLIPVWNSVIRLTLYFVFIQMLSAIKALTENLESKVAARTAELEKLERELVEVGERERRRIGSDLHDGLGQHLTATSLAAHVLRRQLVSRAAPEAKQAGSLLTLIEQSMTISQKLAKGMQPVDVHGGGLMQALQDFAGSIVEMFQISCEFRCDAPVLVGDIAVAEQLYRIAQEATTNAVKHAHASRIVLALEVDEEGVVLAVTDNGIGFVPSQSRDVGMGLRIMAKRANMIGGALQIESRTGGGTKILCRLREEIHGA